MCLIAVLFALYGAITARRRWMRVVFAATLAAQIAAIVLTHSRSGAVAAAIALALFLFRGGTLTLGRKFAAAGVIALALAFAPESFWQRQATIVEYETDVSVAGRENAWKVPA